MRSGRSIRTLAVVASVGLLFGAFVAPAEAGKKKKKKPAGCAAYVPGENGADLPTTVVTDAATAEEPVVVELETAEGIGAGRDPSSPLGANVSHAYSNVQIDTAAATNLFVRIDFPHVFDYDVYLDDSGGAEMANSAGFGPLTQGSDYAHSEVGPGGASETITAFPVADCDGFTTDVVGATTPGGSVTLSYWVAAE